MEDGKPWYASRTIWAGALQAVLGLAIAVGMMDEQQAGSILVTVPDTIVGIIAMFLGALGIQGRVAATKKIE